MPPPYVAPPCTHIAKHADEGGRNRRHREDKTQNKGVWIEENDAGRSDRETDTVLTVFLRLLVEVLPVLRDGDVLQVADNRQPR